uniref:Uncharacterized protein n=1 Tax=Lotharella oceanica TaxID=641309 RepID=A0A7S2X6P8_9EUKA|mmetsp:Transcript_13129/g.25132  ORF Transcript_13129/g.25132 Transcript_13129/m.25132 type:complete len:206 (+) Transcript_13129:27-644(+)
MQALVGTLLLASLAEPRALKPRVAAALAKAPAMRNQIGSRSGRSFRVFCEKPGPGITNQAAERLESVKAGIVGALAGSLAAAPIALLSPNRLSPQWEFDHDGLAACLALSALVYRYAVRNDENPMLKQGAVGAFAIARTLSLLRVSEQCSSLPLSCGPPLGFADWAMIAQGLFIALESFAAFGGMALTLEVLFDKGIIRRFSRSS